MVVQIDSKKELDISVPEADDETVCFATLLLQKENGPASHHFRKERFRTRWHREECSSRSEQCTLSVSHSAGEKIGYCRVAECGRELICSDEQESRTDGT